MRQTDKEMNEEGFLNPKKEKYKLWAGIAALASLVLAFFVLLIAALTGNL